MSPVERNRQRRARAALLPLLGLLALLGAQAHVGLDGGDALRDRHAQLATPCDPIAAATASDELGGDDDVIAVVAAALETPRPPRAVAPRRHARGPRSRACVALVVAPKTSPPLRR